jgi:hypothetical protein
VEVRGERRALSTAETHPLLLLLGGRLVAHLRYDAARLEAQKRSPPAAVEDDDAARNATGAQVLSEAALAAMKDAADAKDAWERVRQDLLQHWTPWEP